ncbi:chitin synthase-domain-containing protein [Chytriomyces sp. MP71]|nr:chitin synthase-domain-containing protein [Chytriomyces sp. MP71]
MFSMTPRLNGMFEWKTVSGPSVFFAASQSYKIPHMSQSRVPKRLPPHPQMTNSSETTLVPPPPLQDPHVDEFQMSSKPANSHLALQMDFVPVDASLIIAPAAESSGSSSHLEKIPARSRTKFSQFSFGSNVTEPVAHVSLSRRPTKMVKKDIVLTDGHFIVETPMGPEYMTSVHYKEDSEFTTLRYTAVTAGADQFPHYHSLRQKQLERKTKIAIVCTMYNEDEVLFSKTISAVMDNIAYLCSLNRGGWNSDSWKEVVVVIVADGVDPLNHRTRDVLSAMGCFMDGLPRTTVNKSSVQAHLFEFTTQIRIDINMVPTFTDSRKVFPMQTIFLLKQNNAKKINSHRWFFNSICSILNPDVCILIDIGTKPTKQSFYHLYRAFQRNSRVAGACGEIATELGSFGVNLINPIVAVQNFEYKMSNILDKPLESMLGYITVLPGAFSAYRYEALLGQPLDMYFKGEALHAATIVGKPNVSESNMYLAEDRILCFELVMKKNSKYILKYVKSAKAETDVPTELHDLIKQRRRWFNGSFFASTYSVMNFHRIFSSGHGLIRMSLLLFETAYNCVNLILSWFSIASIYICFYFMFNIVGTSALIACSQAVQDASGLDPFYPFGGPVSGTMKATYICAVIAMILASLGNKPDTIKEIIILISSLFAFMMSFLMVLVGWTVYLDVIQIPNTVHNASTFWHYIIHKPNFRDLSISLLSTYIMYFLSSILYMDPWHPFTCLIQYVLMIPSFVNILMVYAFCNIHDISWGTKGQEQSSHAAKVTSSTNEKGQEVVSTEVPAPDFYNELDKLRDLAAEKAQKKEVKRDKKNKTSEDHFKSYRTYVVMWWLLSNLILIFFLTNSWVVMKMSVPGAPNPYLVVLLWSMVGMTGVRFIGSMLFLIQWFFERATDRIL